MTNLTTIFKHHSGAHRPFGTSRSARLILLLISGYRSARAGRAAPCRFYPSCSQYAYEAVQVHGALRGSGWALRRLVKCRPLGPHGIDLVPLVKKDRHISS